MDHKVIDFQNCQKCIRKLKYRIYTHTHTLSEWYSSNYRNDVNMYEQEYPMITYSTDRQSMCTLSSVHNTVSVMMNHQNVNISYEDHPDLCI